MKQIEGKQIFLKYRSIPLALWVDGGQPIKLEFVDHKIVLSPKEQRLNWEKTIEDCLKGKKNKLKMSGTDFQMQVWSEIAKIKCGHLMTYSEIAKAIGRPKAYRAVALACGQNPIPLFIPCHRVVGKNDWGGFNGGIKTKFMLLKDEGHLIS